MSAAAAAAAETTNAPAPAPSSGKLSTWEKLEMKVRKEPAVYIFLGLTVGALTGGLSSLYRNNKKQSQQMMKARVFFQFMTVSALLGGFYYRAATGQPHPGPASVSRDNRVYLTQPREDDDAMPKLEDTRGVDGAGKASGGR